MSTAVADARAGRHRTPVGVDRALLVDTGFVIALAAVATFAAWPIYETPYLFITVGGALVVAAVVTLIGRVRRWNWLLTAVTLAIAYLVLGVPLAVPSAFVSRPDLVQGYHELVVATVTGWRKLITVGTPVGHFQTLLVPMLIVVLVCASAAFALVFTRARVRGYGALVPIMLVPTAFAIVFGTSANGSPLTLATITVAAPRHVLVGLLALVLAGGFLVWRAQHERRLALETAAQASGIRRASGITSGSLRRLAGAVAVVLVGLIVAVPVASTMLVPGPRHVLRTAVNPVPQLSRYVSPLTSYRQAFEPAQYDTPLLSYSGDAAAVGRLRIATMSFYNGQQMTVLSGDSDQQNAFAHIPELTGRQPKAAATLKVTINDYRSLGMPDVWLPTAANLSAIEFHGGDVNALTDGFYFNRELQGGAELYDLGSGDSYTMAVDPPAATEALSSLTPSAGAVQDTAYIPASLTQWVQAQKVGSGGQALTELIQRLRDRGYLSHALVAPPATTPKSKNWLSALGVPGTGTFQASFAGESTDRISDLFSALLRQQQLEGPAAPDKSLVAGVGDDEQFAVASALIAESLGFPARVVLGFVLNPSVTGPSAIPACSGGVCKGQNLTAWIEVKGAGGAWVPIATTPQDKLPLAKKTSTQTEPKFPTQVQPRDATVQPPPEANPTGGTHQNTTHTPDQPAGPAVWLPVFRVGGSILLVVLVLLAPFLSLAVVKWARRSERRRMTDAAARVAAGWDELVDTAVDLGLPPPGVRSRAEAAAVYAAAARAGNPAHMRTLASGADEAVFGAFDPTPGDAERYWAQLDEQRARLTASFPRWKRLRALISLRSFRTRRGGSA
ncbi:transglutaminase-like domain-containing protein [Gryllotalpicola reticulitermitis]|uniref:Transglutaminase-like domain-containing protein n=1 Tax=Gryllotalpicola reticulitermitis TaxID=1184153 RepID=A0ABV8Q2E6_9MICO